MSLEGINWWQFNLGAWRRLPRAIQVKAVKVLRTRLTMADVDRIREAADAEVDWNSPYHFGWGMQIRNVLRDAGLRDEMLPPSTSETNKGDRNWDDYYVACVEVAVRGGIWHTLDETERA